MSSIEPRCRLNHQNEHRAETRADAQARRQRKADFDIWARARRIGHRRLEGEAHQKFAIMVLRLAAKVDGNQSPFAILHTERDEELARPRLKIGTALHDRDGFLNPEALALVDVRTLDHIIVAGSSTTSFAERGLI